MASVLLCGLTEGAKVAAVMLAADDPGGADDTGDGSLAYAKDPPGDDRSEAPVGGCDEAPLECAETEEEGLG